MLCTFFLNSVNWEEETNVGYVIFSDCQLDNSSSSLSLGKQIRSFAQQVNVLFVCVHNNYIHPPMLYCNCVGNMFFGVSGQNCVRLDSFRFDTCYEQEILRVVRIEAIVGNSLVYRYYVSLCHREQCPCNCTLCSGTSLCGRWSVWFHTRKMLKLCEACMQHEYTVLH